MPKSPVLSLEFNELVPSIMERFMSEGRLPNFKALHDAAEVFVTDAATTDIKYLEPWIQWVTIHTGIDYEEHGILQLSEGDKFPGKRIWDVVFDAGQPAWVCGSMNVHCTSAPRGAILPDPWSGHGMGPYPDELAPFFDFVKSNVQEHTSQKPRMDGRAMRAFARFMLTHGLSYSTVRAIVGQLIRERFGNHRWRRATILDRLQADVFEWYYRKERPAFSTFFINSVAFLQHRYWRNYDPSVFKVKPSEKDQRDYGDAVLFGYQQLDAIVGRLLRLVGPEATIVFSTALSQQPHLAHEETGGKLSYRPHDYAQFLNAVGIQGWRGVEPVMVGQFHVRFDDVSAATAAESRLNALRVGEHQALKAYVDGATVFAGCLVNQKVPRDAWLELPGTNERWPFYDLIFQIDLVKSGRHHPDGMLWIRTPGGRHKMHDQKVSLCGIAPTVLSILGLPTPPEMHGDVLVGSKPVAV
jgi:hypothetical protein